jgi:hypothetical protein
MPDYKLSREEQETVIRGNAASQEWEIVTADPRIIRRMAKQGYQPAERTNPWGYVSFTVPLDRVRILNAEKRKATGRPFAGKESLGRPANSRAISDQNLSDMVLQGGRPNDPRRDLY